MRRHTFDGVTVAVLIFLGASGAAAQTTKTPADRQIRADVQQRLKGVGARVDVEVEDGVVTLSGSMPNLWTKEEAVRRALKAANIQSINSDLTIAKAEDDAVVAKQVYEKVRTYDRYSIYDYVDGRVSQGNVRLVGAVTAPEKLSDILERVAKVKGVQSIDNKIEVLPTSQPDERLRVAIVNAIYRDPAFDNYSRVDPPIRVIVNNGHVTLIGYVRSQEELIKAESSARMVFGVLALDNKVQLISKATNRSNAK
jgi:osmotically-inducible protein OsmY